MGVYGCVLVGWLVVVGGWLVGLGGGWLHDMYGRSGFDFWLPPLWPLVAAA